MLAFHDQRWSKLNDTVQSLVADAKAGDHRATNELAIAIQQSRIIRGWARRRIGSRRSGAGDMEMSGLCLIADCLRTYNIERGVPFLEYLRRTCGYEWSRESKQHAKSRKIDRMSVHMLPEEMAEVAGREPEPADRMIREEEISRIEPALGRLKDSEGQLIREYYGIGREQGRTLKQMDADAGMQEGSHHRRLARAKKKLAFAYAGE